MTLSIVIVNYNVKEFLEQALKSILKAAKNISHEIIVVDNLSTDGSVEFVVKKFPTVRIIRNDKNVGFAKANNQAISISQGKYVCLINPDTVVQEDTFTVLVDFLEQHPEAGAVGSKVLNPDGTLQLACRRSFPTPWVAFTKICGLAHYCPNSRLFGRYNLTFLDPDKIAEVEAISGSFMIVRRHVIDQVGYLDEAFFMYGEDLDWCYRIQKGGWKIFYVPETQIIHFKGESSKKSPFEHNRMFYEAMRLFVKKHFPKGHILVPSWILIVAIRFMALVSFFTTLIRFLVWPVVDVFIMTISLATAILLRFYPDFPMREFLVVHLLYSISWLICLAGHGLYSKWKYSAVKATSAVFLGLLVNSSITYFFKQIAFSRAVVIYAGVINLFLIAGVRLLVKWMARSGVGPFSYKIGKSVWGRRSIIVGDRESSRKIIHKLRGFMERPYDIKGVILINNKLNVATVAGVPVIGSLNSLKEIVSVENIQEVIFSTDKMPYDKILSTIAASNGRPVSFKLMPSNLDVIIGKATTEYLDDIPLVDIEYKLHSRLYRSMKRMTDMTIAVFLLFFFSPVWIWKRWIRKAALKKNGLYRSRWNPIVY